MELEGSPGNSAENPRILHKFLVIFYLLSEYASFVSDHVVLLLRGREAGGMWVVDFQYFSMAS